MLLVPMLAVTGAQAQMVESRMDTGFPAYSVLFEFGIMIGV